MATEKKKTTKRELGPKASPTESHWYGHKHKECMECGEKLKRTTTTARNLTDLESKKRIFVNTRKYFHDGCSMHGQIIKPVSYIHQVFPYSGYSITVHAEVGRLRLQQKLTIGEIHEYFLKHYPI